MQASFRHAHKPATCQESVAAAVSGHEAVHGHAHHAAAPAEGAEGTAHPRRQAAGGKAAVAGRDAASDGRVLELVRHAGQHGVDVVDHAGGGARGKAPPDGGAQVGPGVGSGAVDIDTSMIPSFVLLFANHASAAVIPHLPGVVHAVGGREGRITDRVVLPRQARVRSGRVAELQKKTHIPLRQSQSDHGRR